MARDVGRVTGSPADGGSGGPGVVAGGGEGPSPQFGSFRRPIAVVGLGVTNLALIRYLVAQGAQVTAFDRADAAALGERFVELSALGVAFSIGDPDYLKPLVGFDLIFLTPGMRKDLPEIEAARAQGAVITTEIDLVLALCKAPVLAITGSAGKTTTTTLVGEILKAQGRDVHVGGNIGTPLIEVVSGLSSDAQVVLELSSFQLQLCRRSPAIGALLNLAPNHLDIHASYEEYVSAKTNVFRFQGPSDWAVLNYDDAEVRGFAASVPGRLFWFSIGASVPGPDGAFVRDGQVVVFLDGVSFPVLPVSAVRLLGRHNLANVVAACGLAVLAGAGEAAILAAVSAFKGVPHRLELVATVDGVRYFNDSISTTPDRTMAALAALPAPTWLILGGSDKQVPYGSLGAAIAASAVKGVLLLNSTPSVADKIAAACFYNGVLAPVVRVADLDSAVAYARAHAVAGDVVLLSPACASFDAYRNYQERGKHFEELVRG